MGGRHRAAITLQTTHKNPMSDNYTKTKLKALVDRLNELTGSPMQTYAPPNGQGTHVPQVGNWHISQAYGGYCVARIVTESGGCSQPIWEGHVPARLACLQTIAFLKGLEFRK
jgi:hypothetical protein